MIGLAPKPEGASEIFQRLGLGDNVTLYLLDFYVGGGVNEAVFSFRNYEFKPFYHAPISSTYVGKYIGNQQEMATAGVITATSPINAAYFDIVEGEYLFNGPNGNHERPVWTFGVSWATLFPLRSVVAGFSIRRFKRLNAGDGTKPRPRIRLIENALKANGDIVTTQHIPNYDLSASEMDAHTFMID